MQFLEAAGRASKRARLAKAVRAFQRFWSKSFRAQAKLLLSRLKKSGQVHEAAAPPPLDWSDDWDEVTVEIRDAQLIAALAALSKAMEASGTALVDELELAIELSFDLKNPRAVAWLEKAAGEMIANVNDATRSAIADIVTDGAANGFSYDRIAREIVAKFDDFASKRARTIAVTELGNAYEQGTIEAAQQIAQAGVALEKAWLTAGDDRVSADCEANGAAGYIDLDDDFPSGDARPLAHPNCRCTLLTRRKEKAA